MKPRLLNLLMGLLAGLFAINSNADTVEVDHQLDFTHSYQGSQWVQHQLSLNSEWYLPLSRSLSVVATSRLRGDSQAKIDNQHSRAELRQFYLQGQKGDYNWQLGKQWHNWQEMDGLNAFNMVTPRDYHEFILRDFQQAALGQWGASLSHENSQHYWQALLIWPVKAHRLPEDDELFSFRASRLRYGFAVPSSTAAPTEQALGKQTRTNHQPLLGFRYKAYQQSWEWGLQMRTGSDFEPLGQITQAKDTVLQPVLEQYYARRTTLSVHASKQEGNLVWRGQLSLSPQRHFNTLAKPQAQSQQLSSVKRNQWLGALGVDWQGPWQLFINAQLLLDHISGNTQHLVRPATDVIGSLSLQRYFNNQQWRGKVHWYASNQADGLLRAKISHFYSDNLSLHLGLDAFYGKQQALFGQYAQQDRLFVEMQGYY